MIKLSHLIMNVFFTAMIHGWLSATNVATQTITFSIDPITEISVSGDPTPLSASLASAGSDPSDVTEESTFYSLTTNGCSEKVVVCINAPMPTGTGLCVTVTAPNGATSVGCIDLDGSNQNVVTGITQVSQSNLQISYILQTTAAAGIITSTTRTVTFTLSP